MQEKIRDLPSVVPLCKTTLYCISKEERYKSLIKARKVALRPPYSLILDKTVSHDKSVLSIILHNCFGTYAVGYVNVGQLKDELFLKVLQNEMKISMEYENDKFVPPRYGVSFSSTSKYKNLTFSALVSNLKDSLAWSQDRIKRILPPPHETLFKSLFAEFKEIGINNTNVSCIISDREPLMVRVCKELNDNLCGDFWLPCLSHLLNSIIKHYIEFYFPAIPEFLYDITRVFGKYQRENRSVAKSLGLPIIQFTPIRWSSLLKSYLMICKNWTLYKTVLNKLASKSDECTSALEFLENEKYEQFNEIMIDSFIPICINALEASQLRKPSYDAYYAISKFSIKMETEWTKTPPIIVSEFKEPFNHLIFSLKLYYVVIALDETNWDEDNYFDLRTLKQNIKQSKYEINRKQMAQLDQYHAMLVNGEEIIFEKDLYYLVPLRDYFRSIPFSGAAVERFFSIVHRYNSKYRSHQATETLMLNCMKKYNEDK
ncbi:hypothetical protein ADUPG1_000282 [Aduncisulcus paluster]|uniref:Uncharacterized protein n=1 Tax=Aduncisulcus paluster TaxID=2918883 RepID=A0ABQ5K5R5_9EUKA|nr:hypothetical protein ADUPG1_000282 [Aduncisulcus paluster]